MNVLIACEFSGTVRRAFRDMGHNAWSCDLLPAEDDSPFHYQGDVLDIIDYALGPDDCSPTMHLPYSVRAALEQETARTG